jgi:WD40 repeat protein/tRNA A-37 threonylcarbamoyl transferase component Bud32
MTEIEGDHPDSERLAAYALGQLDGPEMDVIELHLSSCDSCCRVIQDQPGDSLVQKLRDRRSLTVAAPAPEGEPTNEPPTGFQVPSSFVVGPATAAAPWDQPTVAGPSPGAPTPAGLPRELIDHPRYGVVAAIGTGGMGTVYRALHRVMDRPVALKVIRADLLGNEALVERFRREVKAAARLASHPNIVVAYDAEQAGATHMLVMEFVEGTDLARLVEGRGPLPVGEACEYARQAALGLQHAFEDGMVHRDIKPQNLMRTTRGQIKVLDFGLARFASEVNSRAGVTAPGMMLGSADYIAPEQIDDPHAADIRADIYSLGCTLYFLLAGHPPFPEPSLMQKLLGHGERVPRLLGEVRPGIPPELAQVVARMMAKDPAERFQTPDDVALALSPFADPRAARAAAIECDKPGTVDAPDPWARDSSFGQPMAVPQSAKAVTRAHSRRRWRRLAAMLALAMLPVCAGVLAVAVYRIRTNTGELIIETNDPNIAVTVTQGGNLVTIVDQKTDHHVELRAGRYELRLADGGEGLQLSSETFTLKRGDKSVVNVWHVPTPQRVERAPKSLEDSFGAPAGPTLQVGKPVEKRSRRALERLETAARVAREDLQAGQVSQRVSTGAQAEQVGEIARFQGERSANPAYGGFTMGFLLPDNQRVLYTTAVPNSLSNDVSLRLGDIHYRNQPSELTGHGPGQMWLALSRDGRFAVSMSADMTVRLWNLFENFGSRRIRREASSLGWVAISPDQRLIAYVCGSTVRVCDLQTGDETMSVEAQKEGDPRVAFCSDGRRIVSCAGDIRIWDVGTGKEVRRIGASLWNLTMFPDGRRAMTTTDEYSPTIVWDLETGRQIRRIPLNGAGALAVSGDGRRALLGLGTSICVWDLETSEEIERFEGHRGNVTHLSFSPDGRRAVSSSMDPTDMSVRVWALPPVRRTGERPAVAEVAQFLDDVLVYPQFAVASPDGNHVLDASTTKMMNLWDHETPHVDINAGAGGPPVATPPPAPTTTMRLWDRKSGRLIRRFGAGEPSAICLAIAPDGWRALSGGLDGVLRLWDIDLGSMISKFEGHTEAVFSVAFSPDGHDAYSTSGGKYVDRQWRDGNDSAVRVWDVASGRELRKLDGHKGIVWCVAVSPDGRRVLTCGRDQNVILWDAASGAEIRRFSGHTASVGCVAFLPDGSRAVSSALDRTIRLWDLESGREIHCFRGSSDGLAWLAVSPDGRSMLSADLLGYELRLWDVESRKLVHRTKWANVSPTRGSFTPDGRHAVWGGIDGAVRMYELPALGNEPATSPSATGR